MSHLIDRMLEQSREVNQLKPSMLIVVGIGGSNMGTMAVQQALFGVISIGSKIPVYYVDTVDPEAVQACCYAC